MRARRRQHRGGGEERGYRWAPWQWDQMAGLIYPHPQPIRTRTTLVCRLSQLCRRPVVVLVRAQPLIIQREVPAPRPRVPEVVHGGCIPKRIAQCEQVGCRKALTM